MEVNQVSSKSEHFATKAAAIGAILIVMGLISVAIGPVAFGERSSEWRLLIRYEYAVPVSGYWISVPGCLAIVIGAMFLTLGRKAIRQTKPAHLFLFTGAISGIFSLFTATNLLNIEYYEFYSPKHFQITVFSPIRR